MVLLLLLLLLLGDQPKLNCSWQKDKKGSLENRQSQNMNNNNNNKSNKIAQGAAAISNWKCSLIF